MIKKVLHTSTLLLLFFESVHGANTDYSLRIGYGVQSDQDLGQILSMQDPTQSLYHFDVLTLDGGYLLKPSLFALPVDLYLKSGIAFFGGEDVNVYEEFKNVSDLYKNSLEFLLYLKLYYNIDFLSNRIRIGYGQGVSYVTNFLAPEVIEANEKEDPKYSHILNHLDITFDLDIGKLFRMERLEEIYVGYALKHRSGVFGLINGVKHGGSNYNTLTIERNF